MRDLRSKNPPRFASGAEAGVIKRGVEGIDRGVKGRELGEKEGNIKRGGVRSNLEGRRRRNIVIGEGE